MTSATHEPPERGASAATPRSRSSPDGDPFASLTSPSPLGVFVAETDGEVRYTNRSLQELTGRGPWELLGRGLLGAVPEPDKAELRALWRRSACRGRAFAGEHRIATAAGTTRVARWRAEPMRDPSGAVTGYVGSVEDVGAATWEATARSALTSIIESTTDFVGTTDRSGRFQYLNAAGRALIEVGPDEDISQLFAADLYPAWAREQLLDVAVPTAMQEGSWSGETALRRPDGSTLPVSQVVIAHRDSAGEIQWFSTIIRDMSSPRALEAELQHQAVHDPLTGLPNRVLFLDRLQQMLVRAGRKRAIAVMLIDLDRFRTINAELGHAAADELLRIVAGRLAAALRPSDTAARFGGDEFAVVIEVPTTQHLGRVVDRLLGELSTAVDLGPAAPRHGGRPEHVVVSVSAGVAVAEPGLDADGLLGRAEAARRIVQGRGGGGVEHYDASHELAVAPQLAVEARLRRALAEDDLVIHYQPVVRLSDGAVTGVEALVRCPDGQGGLLYPGDFLGVAERTGLVVQLGEQVLNRACRQLAAWSARHEDTDDTPLSVAVNCSPRQLLGGGLPETVARALRDAGLPPERLCVEVTEHALVVDLDAANEALQEVRRLGVRVAIDDFGTGFSSLTHLRRFVVDKLKIDQTFVRGVGRHPADTAIVAAVIRMGRSLDLDIIGEGAEHDSQLEWLASLGCEAVQGHRLAGALPPEDIDEVLRTGVDFDGVRLATSTRGA